jgi:hypothetical protein
MIKLDVWGWFQEAFSKAVGKAVTLLTQADGHNGLSWEDIRVTAELIRKAEITIGTGVERREWVLEQMKVVQKIVVPHLAELAFWAALNFANQKGWVKLGNN